MEIPFVGPSYNLETRPSGVQRTVNLVPVPQEPGNERTAWVFKDVPGLVVFNEIAAAVATGWADPVDSAGGTIARANSGTIEVETDIAEIVEFLDFYAGIVGYTSGTVVWTLDWAPVVGSPPTKTELAGGIVRLRFTNPDYPTANNFSGQSGLATLTATLDGDATDAGVELAVSDGAFGYGNFAWQAVP